jgi:hypothetical protein
VTIPNSYYELTVMVMKNGGYVVATPPVVRGQIAELIYSASSLDEIFHFIKAHLIDTRSIEHG